MDEFFESVYGPRWSQSLKPAMLRLPSKVHIKMGSGGIEMLAAAESSQAYALDRASLEPVKALALESEMRFLDLCAAPGGKSLAALFLTKGNLRARLNDSSRERVARLKAVLYDYLPVEIVGKLLITCADGARIGQREPEVYERVLADVPCSAERHHLLDGQQEKWTPGSSKRLAIRQHALLCSALDATQPGGRIVYSTCSISPIENDRVVEKLQKSRAGQFEVQKVSPQIGEVTPFGVLILPDRCEGAGPIYYSVLQKLLIEK